MTDGKEVNLQGKESDMRQGIRSNMIEYLLCVIGAFAGQFMLTNASAYRYLRDYKGLDFLVRHYEIEHTQSIEDAVEDITAICHRHGGALML